MTLAVWHFCIVIFQRSFSCHTVTQGLSYTRSVMCFSIGTPKIIDFPFVSDGKFIIFRCPKILGTLQPHFDVLKYWGT